MKSDVSNTTKVTGVDPVEQAVWMSGEMLRHMERQTIALERIAEAARGIVEVQLQSAAFMKLVMTQPEGQKAEFRAIEDYRYNQQNVLEICVDGEWSIATPQEAELIRRETHTVGKRKR